MLAISGKDYELYGCPNCGCDTAIVGNIFSGNTTFSTCENCKLEFMILADGITKSSIGVKIKGRTETEYPIRIEHPRQGINKWKYEWPDPRPEKGEYFNPRPIGYDLAGFVKSREAGERIVEMVKRVLGKSDIKTWLDYRPHEPKWIQVKFQPEEFDLEKLHDMTESIIPLESGIITEEILAECKR